MEEMYSLQTDELKVAKSFGFFSKHIRMCLQQFVCYHDTLSCSRMSLTNSLAFSKIPISGWAGILEFHLTIYPLTKP